MYLNWFHKFIGKNSNWNDQNEIPFKKHMQFLSCAFYVDLNLPFMIRYLGGQYTCDDRNVHTIFQNLWQSSGRTFFRNKTYSMCYSHFVNLWQVRNKCRTVQAYSQSRLFFAKFWKWIFTRQKAIQPFFLQESWIHYLILKCIFFKISKSWLLKSWRDWSEMKINFELLNIISKNYTYMLEYS